MKLRIEPEVRPVVTSALALSGAVGVFALAFGVLAVGAGASVWQACALSFFTFTGASQMSAMSVIASGGSVGGALGGALLLAGRNGVYGLALSPYFGESLGKRLLAAHFVIDETTAMMTAQTNPRLQKIAFWTTAIALFSLWNLGTLIGAVLGSSIDPHTYGLDVGFSAAYVAMLFPHLRTVNGRIAAAGGALLSVVLAPFVSIGLPILASGLAIFVGLRPQKEQPDA
jgi:predicted branched-subunit amino acid permease